MVDEQNKKSWYIITEQHHGFVLFQIDQELLSTFNNGPAPFANFHADLSRYLAGPARDGVKMAFGTPNRQVMDAHLQTLLQHHLNKMLAIVDLTRTILPAMSSETLRNAFVAGYLLGSHHAAIQTIELHTLEAIIVKYYDVAERHDFTKLYAQIRKEFPLVIFWQRPHGIIFIHDEYTRKAPKAPHGS